MPDIQSTLNDFKATIEAKPNLSSSELLSKFPEFKNDSALLQSAHDYVATVNSGKYGNNTGVINSKFPEFFKPIPMARPQEKNYAITPEIKMNDTQGAPVAKQKPLSRKEANQVIYGQMPGTIKIRDVSILPIGKDYQQKASKIEQPEVITPTNSVNSDLKPLKIETIVDQPEQNGEYMDILGSKPQETGIMSTGVGDAVERFEAGAIDMFGNTFGAINNFPSMVLGLPTPEKTEVQIAANEVAEYVRRKADRYKGKNFKQLWKDGDKLGAAGDIALAGAESLPGSLLAMFGGGAGLLTTGASAMTQQYDKLRNNKTMSEDSKRINSMLNGTIQVASEFLGDVPIGNMLKGIATRTSAKAVGEAVGQGLKGWIGQSIKKAGLLFPPVGEGLEEIAAQVGTNVTDYITGARKDWNPFDGAFEAGVYGMGAGAGFSVAGGGMQVAQNVQSKKEFKQADTSMTAMLSRNGYTKQEAEEIKQSLLTAKPEDRNKIVVAISGVMPDAIKQVDGKTQFNPEISNVFTNFFVAADNLQATSSKFDKQVQAETLSQEQQSQSILQQQKDEAAQQLAGMTNKTTGTIQTVKLKDDSEIQIANGTPIFKEDGTFDAEKTGIITHNPKDENGNPVLNEDGTPKILVVDPNSIMSLVSETPVQEAQAEAGSQIDKAVISNQIDNFYPKDVEDYEVDGTPWRISVNPETNSLTKQELEINGDITYEVNDPINITDEEYSQLSGKPIPTQGGETEPSLSTEPIVSTEPAPVQDNEVVQDGGSTTEPAPAYPTDKNGNVDFKAMTDQQIFNHTKETKGEEAAHSLIGRQITRLQAQIQDNTRATNKHNEETNKLLAKAKTMQDEVVIQAKQDAKEVSLKEEYTTLNSKLGELQSLLPKVEVSAPVETPKVVTTRPEILQLRREQEQAQANLDSSETLTPNLATSSEVLQPNMDTSNEVQETPVIDQTPMAKPKETQFQKRAKALGEYIDMKDYILRIIAGGQKLKWKGGLESEFRGSNAERLQRRNYIDETNGLTPTELAHQIWNDYGENGNNGEIPGVYNVSDGEILDEVHEVLRTVKSNSDALLQAEERRTIGTYDPTPEEAQIIDAFDDEMFAAVLGITNFTPEQLTTLNEQLHGWSEYIQHEQNSINPGTTPTSESNSTEGNAISEEGSRTEEVSKEEQFNLTPAKDFEQFETNINWFLKNYGSREMAAIQVELYLNEKPEFGKEYIAKHGITTTDELKIYLGKLQAKLRTGKGNERKAVRSEIDKEKTERNVDEVIKLALEAEAEMQEAIRQSDLKGNSTEQNVTKENNSVLSLKNGSIVTYKEKQYTINGITTDGKFVDLEGGGEIIEDVPASELSTPTDFVSQQNTNVENNELINTPIKANSKTPRMMFVEPNNWENNKTLTWKEFIDKNRNNKDIRFYKESVPTYKDKNSLTPNGKKDKYFIDIDRKNKQEVDKSIFDYANGIYAGRKEVDLEDENGALFQASDKPLTESTPEEVSQLTERLLSTGLAKEVKMVTPEEMTAVLEGNEKLHAVYHGSPHSFDQFSLDHIGTGEGAQAYGHGLYFTDKKEIAQDYAKMADKHNANKLYEIAIANGFDNLRKYYSELEGISYSVRMNDGDLKKAIENMYADYEKMTEPQKKYADGFIEAFKPFVEKVGLKNLQKEIAAQRNLYSVELHEGKQPGQYDYLRWEKPVSTEVKEKIFKQLRDENVRLHDMGSIKKFWDGESSDFESGDNMYGLLSNLLGSQKEASEFLLRAGIDGIQYPANFTSGKANETDFNYVVFDPSAITIKEKVQFMLKPDGTIYGFVKDGVVYLNSEKPNLNTPIHEFGHLFTPIIKSEYPEFYQKGVELIKESPYYDQVKNDPNYSNLDEDGIIDEALNQAIGDKGAKTVQDLGLFAKLRNWINGVWERIGAKFSIKNLTSVQIEKLTLNDWTDVVNSELLNGKKLSNTKNSIFAEKTLKEKQLDIINESNPMLDDYHTGIRSVADIKTLEEAISDPEWDYDEYNPDYTKSMAQKAIETGKVTVYSSNPIKQGVFVSPSKMEAESYSGNGKVYAKEVNTSDVAWIDPTQGQYAEVKEKQLPTTIDVDGIQRPTTNSTGKPIHSTEEGIRNFWKWFGDSKVIDESGRPLVVYHGSISDFNEFKLMDSEIFGSKFGHFFTPDKEIAQIFADRSENGILYETYLKLETPKKINSFFFDSYSRYKGADAKLRKLSPKEYKGDVELPDFKKFREQLQTEGKDGVILNNISIETDKVRIVKTPQYVVFSPTQIKSATGNDGSFSENNANFVEEKQIAYENEQEAIQKTIDFVSSERPTRIPLDNSRGYAEIHKRSVIEGFKESGYVDFIGRKINSIDDVVDMWNIHRSPYIEKSHIIFVKDGSIVGTTATTLNKVGITAFGKVEDIETLYNKFGADGMYLLHNHPSGNHKPSSGDIQTTQKIKDLLPEVNLIGHIVIDHDKYSYIDPAKDGYKEFEQKNSPAKLFYERESVPENNPQKRLFEISKALLNGEGLKGAIIYLSPKLDINAYDVFPEGATQETIAELTKQGLKNNLGQVAIITHDGTLDKDWKVPANVVDVIDTKTGYSTYFENEKPDVITSDDVLKLWEPTKSIMIKPEKPKEPIHIQGETNLDRIRKQRDYYNALQEWNRENYDFIPDGSMSNKWKDQIIRALQDKERYPKLFQNEIMKLMGWNENTIPDKYDWYKHQEHLASKTGIEIEKYGKEFYDPFMLAVAKILEQGTEENKGVNLTMVSDYQQVSHGIERNDWFQFVNNNPEYQDISGSEVILEQNGYPKTKEGAEQLVRDFESKFTPESITELWEKTGLATKARLDILLDGQLISLGVHDGLLRRWKRYVPLVNFDQLATADDFFNEYGGKQLPKVIPLKKVEGRITKAESHFKHILAMGEQAVSKKNKNLLNLTLNNIVNDIPSASPYIFKDKVYYKRSDSSSEWEETTDKPSKELFDAGNAKETKGLSFAIFKPYQAQKHQVEVFVGGVKKIISFTDPRVATGINGTSATSNMIHAAMNYSLGSFSIYDKKFNIQPLKNWASFNRYIKSTYTSFNPDFVIKNSVRDFMHVSYVISIDHPEMLGGFTKYYSAAESITDINKGLSNRGSFGALTRHLFFKPDMNIQADVYLNEFIDNGAATGIGRLKDLEGYEKDFKKRFEEAKQLLKQGKQKEYQNFIDRWIKGSPKEMLTFIERLNEISEVNTRLAVYAGARDSGYSPLKAGSMAKNFSVNFGKSGELTPLLNLVMLFPNPAIQSTKLFFDVAKKHRVRTILSLASLAALSFITAAIARAMSGEDEEGNSYYDMIPEETRRNNVIVFFGFGADDYLMIPISQYLRVYTGIGVSIEEVRNGTAKWTDKIKEFPLTFADDVSPISIGLGFHKKETGDWYIGGIIPQVIKPYYEAYFSGTSGENAFSMPVSGATEYNDGVPEYRRDLKNGAKPFKIASKWLNDISGGDEVIPGAININPDKIEHIVKSNTGGTGMFFLNAYKTASYIYNHNFGDKTEELKPNNIPISRVFYGKASDGMANGFYSREYWDLKTEHDKLKSQIREYRKLGEYTKADKIEKSIEYQGSMYIDQIDKDLKEQRHTIKNSDSQPEIDEAKKNVNLLNREGVRLASDSEGTFRDEMAKYEATVKKIEEYKAKRVLGGEKDAELEKISGKLYASPGKMKSIHSVINLLEKDTKKNPSNREKNEAQIITLIKKL